MMGLISCYRVAASLFNVLDRIRPPTQKFSFSCDNYNLASSSQSKQNDLCDEAPVEFTAIVVHILLIAEHTVDSEMFGRT